MVRIVLSCYLFVSFFDIIFFIKTIHDALREVNCGLYELQEQIDKVVSTKGCVEVPLIGIDWVKAWPYLVFSVCPICNLAFFYTFIMNGSKIYGTFFNIFQGRAIKNVKKMLEDLGMKSEENKEEE